MLHLCTVSGGQLPLGHDDVREYLSQFGEVREHALNENWPPGSTFFSVGGDRNTSADINAYPSNPWVFWATSPGRAARSFDDITKACRFAFPNRF